VSLEAGLLFLGGPGLLDDSGQVAATGDLEVLRSPFRAQSAANAVVFDHFKTMRHQTEPPRVVAGRDLVDSIKDVWALWPKVSANTIGAIRSDMMIYVVVSASVQ